MTGSSQTTGQGSNGHARVLGELALEVAGAMDRPALVVAIAQVLQREMDLSRLELTLPEPAGITDDTGAADRGPGGWTSLQWDAGITATRPSEPPPPPRSSAPKMRLSAGRWGLTVPVPMASGPAGQLTLGFPGDDIPRLASEAELATAVGCFVGMACHRCDMPLAANPEPMVSYKVPEPEPAAPVRPLNDSVHDAIVAALRHARGKLYGEGGAAQLLGLKPSTLQAKMAKLGIERTRFVPR